MKPRILTVTLSPCVDVATSTQIVKPEHKLRCAAPMFRPGGGGVNVARVLARMSSDVTACMALAGSSGQHFLQLLSDEQVNSLPFWMPGETRQSLHVHANETAQEFRFVFPGCDWQPADWPRFQDFWVRLRPVDYAVWVISGSLPPGLGEDAYGWFAREAHRAGAQLFLDTSGPALLSALATTGVYLIKPSWAELEQALGQRLPDEASAIHASRKWLDAAQVQWVLVSNGAAGAMLIGEGHVIKATMQRPAQTQSTVGAGDSLLAGFIHAQAEGMSLHDSMRFAVAAATATVEQPSGALCTRRDVDERFPQVALQAMATA